MERHPNRILFALLPACVAAMLAAGCGSTRRHVVVVPVQQPPAATNATTPAARSSVPGACTLVTQQDLASVTKDTLTLQFTGDPVESSDTDPTSGASSTCRLGLKSSWDDGGGTLTVDGLVTVEIQADGAKFYFPVTSGQPVTGLGDEAMSRDGKLYVRVSRAVLVLDIGIANPSDDRTATQIAWAEQLAKLALGRIG
ncbi:MAG TPA: hypothetical protein VKB69_14935 [Micromonosporaceae bacterium]|nr:hypothetical protein [Micromonosporaceae bacterium]